MKIRFVHDCPAPGGLTLAVERLALALSEWGHSCDLLVPAAHHPNRTGAVPQMASEAVPAGLEPIDDLSRLTHAIAEGNPELVIVGSGRADLLEASAASAPTLLHSQAHWAVCADGGRYWNRLGRECRVRAGLKCTALRPLLGCSSRERAFEPQHVRAQQRLIELLSTGAAGAIAISSRQSELLADHGVPSRSIAVIPNLGMRMTAAELATAAANTPAADRSAVTFFGRLSKEKGAQHLLELAALLGDVPLRIFGEGYLEDSLYFGSDLRGHVSQERVAGVLQWARAIVFPSRWPEPGGIVGIDAQLFGSPLAAFNLGAALDWPCADLFEAGDITGVAKWATQQSVPTEPRDPDVISFRQSSYWSDVSARASRVLEQFEATGVFLPTSRDAVCRSIATAVGKAVPDERPTTP